jgi:hypothetical protein
MNWPFDDGSDLPLRDGFDVGGAQERTMASMVGGYSGIRTVEELNPDGSITILRTRGGRPIFETTGVVRRSAQAQKKKRGFVAKIPTRAVLFDPYTLDILDANYQPAVNTYSVQDFATSWNVPAADDTDWYDVVLFDGSTIKVNAKAMPALGITANHGYPAIPYVINRETAEDQYGNAERNTTEKRVFAVGRYSVTSWGGGGVTETLTPTAPRTEDRAMTIGQRVDPSTDTATLAHLYYTGAEWDANAGAWAFSSAEVTMLLAAAYLTKTAAAATVTQSSPAMSAATRGWNTAIAAEAFPPTPISLVGTGVVTQNATRPGDGARVAFPWSGTYSASLSGEREDIHRKDSYSAAASGSQTQAGRTLTYSVSASGFSDYIQSILYMKEQRFTFAPGYETGQSYLLTLKPGGIVDWYSPLPTGPRGRGEFWNKFRSQLSGSYTVRDEKSQSCALSVAMGADILSSVDLSRVQTIGNNSEASPNLAYYDVYLADPWGKVGVGSGMGMQSVAAFYEDSSVGPTDYDTQVLEKMAEGSAQEAARTYYDSEFNSGWDSRAWYTGSIQAVNTDIQALSWTSKDYLLYDAPNGVYISVLGDFSGAGSAVTLTITLKVQTRHHVNTIPLGEFSFTYAELLPRTATLPAGEYQGGEPVIPVPKITTLFAPLYQEQGSFKGAHYVTADEEVNGSSPAHFFNFLLYLDPYSAIGTVNTANENAANVRIVPCNLLEMLYAFVFSQEYGVGATRYPVSSTTRYNAIMDTLFATPTRIAIRDGVQGNWPDSFGSDFASISTVSLHRT